MYYFIKCLKNYTNFRGRARRKEYWMFVLFDIIFVAVAALIDKMIGTANVIAAIYGLAVLLPKLAVFIRRLHDIGKSGWWILLSFIPVVGFIILLVWACKEGDVGDNEYGPNPKLMEEVA